MAHGRGRAPRWEGGKVSRKRDTLGEVRAALAARVEAARANQQATLQEGSIFTVHGEGCPLLGTGLPCVPIDAVDEHGRGCMTGPSCTWFRGFVRDRHELQAWLDGIPTGAMVEALARAIEGFTAAIPSVDRRNAARERLASFWPFAWAETEGEHGADVARALRELASHETRQTVGTWGGALPSVRPWPPELSPEALARALESAAPNDRQACALAFLLRQGVIRRGAEGFPTWPAADTSFAPEVRAALETLGPPVPLLCVARALASAEHDARGRLTWPTGAHHRTVGIMLAGQRSKRGLCNVDLSTSFVRLEYVGERSKGQLEFDFPEPLPSFGDPTAAEAKRAAQWAFSRFMQREHASALYDYAAIVTSGSGTWTWEIHRERTPWGDRVRRGDITDRDACAEVCARLERWERAKVWIYRQNAGRWAAVVAGDMALLSIIGKGFYDAGRVDGPYRAARLRMNPALFQSAREALDGKGSKLAHFAPLPGDVLCAPWLDPYALRLLLFLPGDMRAAIDGPDAGVIRRRSSWLAALAGLPDCKPAERDQRLRAALSAVQGKGVIGAFQPDAGPPGDDRLWTIRPSSLQVDAWFYPRSLPAIEALPPDIAAPVALAPRLPAAHALPTTGAELRAWRAARGLTQARAADALGVHARSIIRAEQRGEATLSRDMLRAIAAKGHTT